MELFLLHPEICLVQLKLTPVSLTPIMLLQDEVRNNVKPIMYVRMRLGEFDPPEMNPYLNITDMSLLQCETHRQIALDAAMKSFVLLKNNHNALPLNKTTKLPVGKVAVSISSNSSVRMFILQPMFLPVYSSYYIYLRAGLP